ncbi:MAG: hypothetical protein ABIK09_08100 [Pseudomonadota bacterium]
MNPLLISLALLTAPLPAVGPSCRVEQHVIAWSTDGEAALLYQHQTCVPHLPPVSLWLLNPGDGGVGERLEIWRLDALDGALRVRGDALVKAGGFDSTPLDRSAALPGVLVPHPDPDLRDQGAMGSPFLSEASSFMPYDGDPEGAAERCAASFPCGGLCVYVGHYAPGRRWLVCAPGGLDGVEPPLRYVRLLPGGEEGGSAALDLEKELGRWNGRVLKQRNALRDEGTIVAQLGALALGEIEQASTLLVAAAERCSPEVWVASRRFVTVRGIPADLRVRLLDVCRPHVPAEDADFVMALATSDATPLAIRVAAGRILGGMRGETPGRLKGKLWRFEPPKEVMDAIHGK